MTVFQCALAILAMVAVGRCAELSLPSSIAAPAASLSLPVSFASQSNSVTAIQFDLRYDSTAVSLCTTAGESARLPKKTLYAWDVAPGQRRFLIFGRNADTLVDGILIDLVATLNADAPSGVYPLTLLNVVAADTSARAVNINAVNGVITVQQTEGSKMIRPLRPRACPTFSALDSASVSFEGSAAPLPLIGKASTQGQAAPQIQPGGGLPNPVKDADPSIFIPDGSGIALDRILNYDYSVNSPDNPAKKGSVIMLFARGDWRRVPPESATTVSVLIGGLAAQVFYPDAAPVLVDGVLQINCILPLDSPLGVAVPILVYAENRYSLADVTVAIQ